MAIDTVEAWLRAELKTRVAALIAQWAPRMGVTVADWGIKRMKTRWGTCNVRARRIWLNPALIAHPPACLEYVVVHELTHLLERHHNARFHAWMDRFLPDWRTRQAQLNGQNQRGSFAEKRHSPRDGAHPHRSSSQPIVAKPANVIATEPPRCSSTETANQP
ncbi:M48 family metallopeptidase [Hydrogenophilus thiooxidans]|uniref:M48 family metallopeptidase n=1 Tax=Hydrogenophilus thiooxidans TaxID=2820326 RepID=UPI001C240FC8